MRRRDLYWSYSARGELKATPHIGGIHRHACAGFDNAQHGLKAVPSAVFMGMLFVNLSGDAPAFAEYIAPLEVRARRLIGERGFSQLALAGAESRGRVSPSYAGGVFSPVMDELTHHFHRWVASRLRAG